MSAIRRIRFVVTILPVLWAISVLAQTNSSISTVTVAVPTLVRYSGTLPAVNTMAGVTFALYKEQDGGAPLWLETQNVTLDGNGRYTVNLGTNHAGGIPAELFAAGEARWLGVQPEEQAEQPRVLLVSVPYAMKAADADTLGGLPASSYVTANQLSAASRQSPGQAAESAAAAGAEVTPAPCNSVSSDGTALANYLTKFTAPCNVEDSGIYQSALATTPGFLGIGTTAPVAPLDMEPAAQTGTSGGLFGVHVIANFNPTGNSTGNYYAFYGQSNSSMGNATNFTGDIVGSGFIAQHYGTGTVTNLFGANYSVQNRSTGTVTNAVGFFGGVSNLGAGTITNGYGLQVPVPQNSGGGVFTNFYGVYIANPTGITNSWGLYTLAGQNYMSGKLGINVMAPTQALEINGNLKFDNAGHGITYADGTVQTTASLPGTGTITKVTAGTDLTGGGSSGAVTVNLDTTKVPTLAATTNTFTGTGGIHAVSFTGDGTNVTNVNATELGSVAASGYPQLATPNGFTAAQNITGMGSGYILEAINNFTGSGSSAIYATSAGSNAVGVYGEADNGTGAAGIYGKSSSGYGVYGMSTSSAAGSAGVYGTSTVTNAVGIQGESDSGSGAIGVLGGSTNGIGVSGIGAIYGVSGNGGSGVGVFGEANSSANAIGVEGVSTSNVGVYGQFNAASSEGASVDLSSIGVWADTNTGVALVATADNNSAARFYSNAAIDSFFPTLYLENLSGNPTGALLFKTVGFGGAGCTIDGAGNVACTGTIGGAAVAHDQRKLEMYSVQSTENWYEDAGSGQLRNGFAAVPLDTDFADIVNAGMEYHVFLTPKGDCKGLYVANETAGGFEVRELGGGHAGIGFDYRIMAKRKGKESLRMKDVTERMNAMEAMQPARRKEGATTPLHHEPPMHPHLHPPIPVPSPQVPVPGSPPHHAQPAPPLARPVQKASLVGTK